MNFPETLNELTFYLYLETLRREYHDDVCGCDRSKLDSSETIADEVIELINRLHEDDDESN